MKICKKALTVLLAFSMLISFCFVFSSAADGKAMHISNTDNIYGGDNYLFDTLTLAGSGFEENMTYTVAALENLALDESLNLAYSDTYSMLTSGGVYSSPSFEGLKLYDLLVYSGLDTTCAGQG